MDKETLDLLLLKYFNGSISEQEQQQIENWINQSPENSQKYFRMKNIYDNSYPPFDPENINVDQAYEKVTSHLFRSTRIHLFWSRSQQIAAILLLPVLLSFLYFYHRNNIQKKVLYDTLTYIEVTAPTSTSTFVLLPDSSRVWLSSQSKLMYPHIFVEGDRRVKLIGEGYFEVVSDKKNPFIVETNSLSVTATGTAFNVEAYEKEENVNITLVRGKVDVIYKQKSLSVNIGERIQIDTMMQRHIVNKVEPEMWCAWKDGILIFRDQPLSEIFKRLEHIYNIELDVTNMSPDLLSSPIRATFEKESIDEILRLLKHSTPFEFEDLGRLLNPSDSLLMKRKFLIRNI